MTSLLDAVAEATEDAGRVYRLGSVPASPAYPYTVFSAQLLEDVAATLEKGASVRWVQVVAQTFGRTVDSVNGQSEGFRSLLIGKWLSFDGYGAGPVEGELRPTPPTRDPDTGGVLGSTTTLTAIAEEA